MPVNRNYYSSQIHLHKVQENLKIANNLEIYLLSSKDKVNRKFSKIRTEDCCIY